jgi:hypothetical protein
MFTFVPETGIDTGDFLQAAQQESRAHQQRERPAWHAGRFGEDGPGTLVEMRRHDVCCRSTEGVEGGMKTVL